MIYLYNSILDVINNGICKTLSAASSLITLDKVCNKFLSPLLIIEAILVVILRH